MSIRRAASCAALAAVLATNPAVAADAKGGIAAIDPADCAGFTVKDAAPFLGVPAAQIVRHVEKVTRTLVICSFAAAKAAPGVAFSIEVEANSRKAAEQMERYRDHLMTAGDTAPWKGKLPKGAYYVVIDNTATAGRTQPGGALLDDRAAMVSLAVELGDD